MDGSPQLLTNIQFAEAKKGYDRGQVDNFLRELSVKIGELQDMLRQATQRAESAEARATEAAKGRNAAESDVVALREDLRVIAMSATLDTTRVASLLGGSGPAAPIVASEGRAYPVEIRWRPLDTRGLRGEQREGEEPIGREGAADGRNADDSGGLERADRSEEIADRRMVMRVAQLVISGSIIRCLHPSSVLACRS